MWRAASTCTAQGAPSSSSSRSSALPPAAHAERAVAVPSAARAPYMPAAGAPLQGALLVDQPSRAMLFGGMLNDAATQHKRELE